MEYIRIGKIINTHGIKGELKIESYSDFDKLRYKIGNTVYIEYENQYIPCVTKTFRIHKGFPLVSFEDLQNINFVEKYKNCYLYIDKQDRKPLKKGEFYRDELVGLSVYDESNHYIGEVDAVEETFASQIHLRIHRENQNDALVPYVPLFIKNVDMQEKKLTIHVVEGLL